ncbi:MAG TPA: tail fiber domain-containing protein [Pyrinomonadaceae bacterium]|nr:tail fiber domain-containing protein [Pyrinomonadaceae bacterium]
MKNLKHLPSMLTFVFVVAAFTVSVLGQANEDRNNFATISNTGSGVRFDVGMPHAAVTLTVIGPDGVAFTKEFKSGNSPEFKLTEAKGERLPDGQYTYELRVTPIISTETKEALKAAREKDNVAEVHRELRRRGALPAQAAVQSGSFLILNGSVIIAGATEGNKTARTVIQQPASARAIVEQSASAAPVVSSGRTSYKIQRHHPRFMFFTQVIPDDLVVQGSLCVGLDCVSTESFGTDTIRLKENNTRLQFDDTSVSAGFATNNWQIRANDQPSGGASFLGIVDQGTGGTGETGTIVLAVEAGASANSLRVASNSKVGFRTATPVLDMHANTSDTPAIRFEQNNTGGFSAQTWDVAGNEANFFVRDVTSGSRLPFRIRPGAPTSSIDIAATGRVGVGTASPSTSLHLNSATAAFTSVGQFLITDSADTNRQLRFGYDSAIESGWIQASKVATNFEPLLLNPNGGNVGIGTSAPTDALSVSGNASKTTGGTWAVFSDERLKNIKGSFNTGLKAVMQLQPVRYEYRSNNTLGIKSEGEHIGFGAQAVQKVIPEAVMTNANGYLMVNSDPILWTMLNAIKEQQKEIAELKRQIRQLRSTTRRRR